MQGRPKLCQSVMEQDDKIEVKQRENREKCSGAGMDPQFGEWRITVCEKTGKIRNNGSQSAACVSESYAFEGSETLDEQESQE